MDKSKSISIGRCIVLACGLIVLLSGTLAAKKSDQNVPVPAPSVVVNDTYIDAATIFMFVTNHGNFGRDLSGVFGHDYGTYYPYIDTDHIESGVLANSPHYAAGCWLGGIDNATDNVLIALSEYSSEFVPGPMFGGTYDPDYAANPYYRVYKLHSDSSNAHPNTDYLDYLSYAVPVMGAPTDHRGKPLLLGDQTLWTVFNDADPDQHNNDAGETAPLGVEVQMSVWASDGPGNSSDAREDEVVYDNEFEVTGAGHSMTEVSAWAVVPDAITGHDYRVVLQEASGEEGLVWHLDNLTTDTRLLESQSMNTVTEVVEGLVVAVYDPLTGAIFSSFEVTANANGVLDPPEAGALCFADFPVPTERDPDGYITDDQQVNGGHWAIHTADDGGTCGGGTRRDYEAFLSRVTRNGENIDEIGGYDYEMRFTGSHDNPGVNGGYAIEWYNDENVIWVPFEIWRTGINTPDDPSDDVRLVPFMIDSGNDDVFGLESWGCILDPEYGGDGEHSASGSDDDPFTDWIYWNMPTDDTPGEAGYFANQEDMLAGTFDHTKIAYEILARTVLLDWNGGVEPPFVQSCPEMGTIFRIVGGGEFPVDTFTFTSSVPPSVATGAESQSIYIAYKLFNEGGNALRDCYFSLWTDPDVGTAGDDKIGCDTLDNLFFAYNGQPSDARYGCTVPAVGFKFLYGPLVPSEGDSAYFDRKWIHGYKNLDMSAFTKYINGTDPDNWSETYGFMRGLTKSGAPYLYGGDELTYMHSGDPVTGTGDLDYSPEDVRGMGSCGPFDLNPGDSQYVLIKMAVAQGSDRLSSITRLREILNLPFELKLPGPKGKLTTVPEKFEVCQNYPNPFNPTTTIQYGIAEQAHVTVDVFNVLGQKVKRLVNKTQAPGVYNIEWNSTDEGGNSVASGIYFYRVQAGEHSQKKTMVLVR